MANLAPNFALGGNDMVCEETLRLRGCYSGRSLPYVPTTIQVKEPPEHLHIGTPTRDSERLQGT